MYLKLEQNSILYGLMHPQKSKYEVLILFQWHIPWVRDEVLTALPLQTSIFRGLDKVALGLNLTEKEPRKETGFLIIIF